MDVIQTATNLGDFGKTGWDLWIFDLKNVKSTIGVLVVMYLRGLYLGTHELDEIGHSGTSIEATYKCMYLCLKVLKEIRILHIFESDENE